MIARILIFVVLAAPVAYAHGGEGAGVAMQPPTDGLALTALLLASGALPASAGSSEPPPVDDQGTPLDRDPPPRSDDPETPPTPSVVEAAGAASEAAETAGHAAVKSTEAAEQALEAAVGAEHAAARSAAAAEQAIEAAAGAEHAAAQSAETSEKVLQAAAKVECAAATLCAAVNNGGEINRKAEEEDLALWERWQFWQVVVPALMALVGFTFGVRYTDCLHRRREQEKEERERNVIGEAFAAEIALIDTEAASRIDNQLKEITGTGEKPTEDMIRWLLKNGRITESEIFRVNLAQVGILGTATIKIAGLQRSINIMKDAITDLLAENSYPDPLAGLVELTDHHDEIRSNAFATLVELMNACELSTDYVQNRPPQVELPWAQETD